MKYIIIALLASSLTSCAALKALSSIGGSGGKPAVEANVLAGKTNTQNKGQIAASGAISTESRVNAESADKSALGADSQAFNGGIDKLNNNTPAWELGLILIIGFVVGWYLRDRSARRETKAFYLGGEKLIRKKDEGRIDQLLDERINKLIEGKK